MRYCLIVISLVLFSGHLSGQPDPYLSGRASMLKGEYELARMHFEQALESEPGNTEILLQMGISCLELDRATEAWDCFFEVEKRKKGMASFYLAKTECRLNHPEIALKYLREHLSSHYRRPEKELLLDEDLMKLEGSQGWQTLWNEQSWYGEDEQILQEAIFLAEHGQELESLNKLIILEKKGFRKSEVRFQKALIYDRLGNKKAAASSLEDALKSDSRNLDALARLVPYQVENRDMEDALYNLNRILRSQPYRFEAYLLRAEVQSSLQRLKEAEEDIDLYLTYFPESHRAHYLKGKIRYDHGRFLDAIRSFNQALKMDAGESEYYFSRGLSYAATGTTKYAEQDMSMALDLDPYNGQIWLERGKLKEKLGQRPAACQCYRKAFQYGIFEAGELVRKTCQ